MKKITDQDVLEATLLAWQGKLSETKEILNILEDWAIKLRSILGEKKDEREKKEIASFYENSFQQEMKKTTEGMKRNANFFQQKVLKHLKNYIKSDV